MGFADKFKEVLQQREGQVRSAVDKAGCFVDEKTKGKYHQQITKAGQKADEMITKGKADDARPAAAGRPTRPGRRRVPAPATEAPAAPSRGRVPRRSPRPRGSTADAAATGADGPSPGQAAPPAVRPGGACLPARR